MDYSFWPEFAILMTSVAIGASALIPYSFKLLRASASKKPLKIPLSTLALLSFVQNLILGAITVGGGLFVAHEIGLGAPTLAALVTGHSLPYSLVNVILWPVIFGLVIGLLMTIVDLAFLPYWPEQILTAAKDTSLPENFSACFYGGLNEELLTRLFGVSVIAWLLSLGHHTGNTPAVWIMWAAITLMAVLFALGHLPALKGVAGKISNVMLSRTLVLNIPLAIVCGWLYWKYGIEAAILTHFSADVIYHVGGTVVLRAKLAKTK